MIVISHRGNINGPAPGRENSPDYIDEALRAGYEVEVDLRTGENGEISLGHDVPQYTVTRDWLYARKDKLWIHAKDSKACLRLFSELNFLRWYTHDKDRYSLTSTGHLWLCDKTVKETEDCIVTLVTLEEINWYSRVLNDAVAYGVCTDYCNMVDSKII